MGDTSARTLPFLPRLEALRGLAAVAVVGYHAVNDEVVTGMAPVVLFFVLSGFVLARSLSNDGSPFRFFRNRILRLLPAAAASVLLLSFLHWQWGFYVGVPRSFDLTNIALNALMIRSDINGPMWSLTVECFAAPLILGSFFAYEKFGRRPLVLFCAALFGLSFWGDYVHLLGGVTSLAPLYAFVIGVCLHFATTEGWRIPAPGALTLAALSLFLACGLRKQTSLTIFGEATASGALIFLIANAGKPDSIFAALDLAPIRFIGRISYSFYLLHLTCLGLAERLHPPSALLLFFLTVGLTVPIAWLSWRFVETPFIRLKSRGWTFGSMRKPATFVSSRTTR